MFSGLVHGDAKVTEIIKAGKTIKMTIATKDNELVGVKIGDSIAVDGCCLTVESFDQRHFTVTMMPQTFNKTVFKDLEVGERVNIERALQVGSRLDGHLVLGHVDETVKLLAKQPNENAIECRFALPKRLKGQVIDQGSVALDGISLTVMQVGPTWFSVGLIPHTQEETNLADLKVGAEVNLETDIIGKYLVSNLAKMVKEGANNGR